MNQYQTFKAEAEKTVKPLAARVRTLEKQRVAVQERIVGTREDVDRKAAALAAHREAAGESLTKSTSAFNEWQGRLRRLEREHGTGCEALALLERDIRAQTDRELEAARQKRQQALDALYNAAKPACEERMAALLAAVVDERDAFVDAWAQVYQHFGTHLAHLLGGSSQAPVAMSDRLDKIRHPITGKPWVTFKNPPPVVKPPVASIPVPEAAPDAPEGTAETPNAPRVLLTGRTAGAGAEVTA